LRYYILTNKPAVANQVLTLLGEGKLHELSCELVLGICRRVKIEAPGKGIVFGSNGQPSRLQRSRTSLGHSYGFCAMKYGRPMKPMPFGSPATASEHPAPSHSQKGYWFGRFGSPQIPAAMPTFISGRATPQKQYDPDFGKGAR
jgi:hypothetical protein